MKCHSCGNDVAEGALRCESCKAEVRWKCSSCGQANPMIEPKCAYCGANHLVLVIAIVFACAVFFALARIMDLATETARRVERLESDAGKRRPGKSG